ncbi:HK97-gp10 family putative phage morphogenesis protein [Solidesulfovibrio sp.]
MAQAAYASNCDAIIEAVRAGIEAGVSEAVERVADRARQLCPVGTVEKGARRTFMRVLRGRKKKDGTRNYKKVRVTAQRALGWTARRPGTLRDSIFTRVRWKDGVCLGWVKAGAEGSPDGSAFYAPFVELGTAKMQADPFMRPALRGARAACLNDIGVSIGLEIGQTTRRGVKRKVYGA